MGRVKTVNGHFSKQSWESRHPNYSNLLCVSVYPCVVCAFIYMYKFVGPFVLFEMG